jgi:hypothetical protein
MILHLNPSWVNQAASLLQQNSRPTRDTIAGMAKQDRVRIKHPAIEITRPWIKSDVIPVIRYGGR